MVQTRWQVRFTRAVAVTPAAEPMPFVADLPADWEGWIAGEGLAIGTPFLISPTYEFDVVLNGYFLQASMVGAIGKTREAHARDLAAFLSFLRLARNEKCWRDVAEADHLAYLGVAAPGSVGAESVWCDVGSRSGHGEPGLPVGGPVGTCCSQPDSAGSAASRAGGCGVGGPRVAG